MIAKMSEMSDYVMTAYLRNFLPFRHSHIRTPADCLALRPPPRHAATVAREAPIISPVRTPLMFS